MVGMAGGTDGYGDTGRVGTDEACPGDRDDVGVFHVPAGHHDGGRGSEEGATLPGLLGHFRDSFRVGFGI